MIKDSGMITESTVVGAVVGSLRLFNLGLGRSTAMESFAMKLALCRAFGPCVGSFGLTLVHI